MKNYIKKNHSIKICTLRKSFFHLIVPEFEDFGFNSDDIQVLELEDFDSNMSEKFSMIVCEVIDFQQDKIQKIYENSNQYWAVLGAEHFKSIDNTFFMQSIGNGYFKFLLQYILKENEEKFLQEKIQIMNHTILNLEKKAQETINRLEKELSEETAIFRETNKLFSYKLKRYDDLKKLNDYIKDYADVVTENLSSGFMSMDMDLRIERWNKKMTDITGLKNETVQKRYIFSIIPGFKYTKLKDYFSKVIETGEIIRDDRFIYSDKEGNEKRIFYIQIFPIKQKSRTIGLGMLSDDITEEKINEEKAIIGTMSLYLSHIIRNSLNIAGGYLKYLLNPKFSAEKKNKFMNIIQTEIHNIEESVRTLETYANMKTTENNEKETDFLSIMNEYLSTIFSKNFIHESTKSFLAKYLKNADIDINMPLAGNKIIPVKLNYEKFSLSMSYLLRDIIKFLSSYSNEKIKIRISVEEIDNEYVNLSFLNNSPYWQEISEESILYPWKHEIDRQTFDLWGIAIFNSMISNFKGTFSIKKDTNYIRFDAKIPIFGN